MRFFSKISVFTPPAGAEKHPRIRSNFAHLIFSRVCHFSSLAILTYTEDFCSANENKIKLTGDLERKYFKMTALESLLTSSDGIQGVRLGLCVA